MKQKHWKVSVFDKTAEIVRDDTLYTSDTEVFLKFEVTDEDFTYDSAMITLYNIYGKATRSETVEVTSDVLEYEMKEDIMFAGGWRVQVVFIKDGEHYSGKKIEFDVDSHLLDSQKPSVVHIENWNLFMRHAGELVDDWEQLEEIRQANEQQRELAESARQTTFETNETTRQSEFETNETSRQANELVREEAEGNRQSTFETNEAEREITFEVSESTRQVNELIREEAEGVRQSTFEENELARESSESERVANEEERISKDSERDSKIEAVEGLQADLISGAVDSAAVQQHVEQRYGQLEEEYAPKLTEVTAQLAQTNSRFDDVITTPVDGNITQQEIIDARQGFRSLGENLRNIRGVSENKLIDKRANTPFLYNFEIDSNGVLNFIISEMPLTLNSIVWEDLTLKEIFAGNMLLKTNYVNLANSTNITVDSSTNILSWGKITSTQTSTSIRSELLPSFNKAYVKVRYKTTAVQGIMRFSGTTTVISNNINEDNSWVEDSYYGLFSPRETYPGGIRFEYVNLNPEQTEVHVDLNKSTLIDLGIFNDLPTKEQLDEWHDIYTQLNGGYQ